MTKLYGIFFTLILVTVASAQPSTVDSKKVELIPCEVDGAGPNSKEKALCGTYEVFENRAEKRGRKISIKIVIFPASGPDKAAILYPGGPGFVGYRGCSVRCSRVGKNTHSPRPCFCRPTGNGRIKSTQL